MVRLRAVLLLLLVTSAGLAQRPIKVPDPDPELERKTFQVPEGFEVNLFAGDPLLAKPIQMNFDAAGRLWVASSETYPQIAPGQKADDKIIILEDTKGVGRADKTTIFARGLLIPTGLEPGDGGCYVANSTEMLFFPEKNGKAGEPRVVLSGFGTEDTHHIVHTFRWGHDGMLYFNQSIYIHSHLETPHGPRRLNAGGIWQFRPETLQLDVFARGWVNSWGHHFDRWGQSFATDGAGGEGINYVVPGGYYVAAQGPHAGRLLHGLNPGHPKYCGEEIVSGRHLPPDWQGNVITNDFRGHRVCRFALKEDGAGFIAQPLPDLIRSTHPAFRPVDVKMGPDGAIYVADWYNPIIQHGEVDFRDPRRDHTHGRIWRITAKGRKTVERPKLVDAPVASLLEQLKAPEQWTRHFAKRVMKERGAAAVTPALAHWVAGLDPNQPDYEHHLLEALWMYQSVDVVEPALLGRLLKAKTPQARAAAVRVASQWQSRVPSAPELIAEAVTDEHPRVRLEAVRALAAIPQVRSAEAALTALDKPIDKWLDYSLWLTMRELEPVWGPALQRGEAGFQTRVPHLVFALNAAEGRRNIAPMLVNLIRTGKVSKAQQTELMVLLTNAGGPGELGFVFDQVFQNESDPETRVRLISALDQAGRTRQMKPTGDLRRIDGLLKSGPEPVRAAAARLAGAWKIEPLRPTLFSMAVEAQGDVRRAAVEGLATIGGAESRDLLERLTGPKMPADLRTAGVVALANLDLPRASKAAAASLSTNLPTDQVAAILSAFAQRKGAIEALAQELKLGKWTMSADVAKVALRTVRAAGRDIPTITAALTQAGNLAAPKRALTPIEIQQMVADVSKLGDAARGEAIYRRKEMACLKCHAIAGAGGLVGPDLLSIGASAQVDYLIESMLLPNAKIKEGFNTLKIEMVDGRQVTGVRTRETPTELVIRDGEDREITVAKAKIESQANSGSLMPEGLVDGLTRSELIDLVRFLSELGKVGGPYAVSPARVMRRWQVLEPSKEAYTALSRTGIQAAANDASLPWSPAYSNVAGVLPADQPRFILRRALEKAEMPVSFVRGQIEVTTPGLVRVKLDSTAGLALWVDGSAIEPKSTLDLNLKAGVHTVTFSLDWSQRTDGLRLELEDAMNSTARARLIGGK